MSKAYIEHESGFIDLESVAQVNFSTARGGTIAVATSGAAEGFYGQVVAHLDPEAETQGAPAPIPAELPSEQELEKLSGKLKTLARGLLAEMQALAAFEGGTAYIVKYDAHRQKWDVDPAEQTFSPIGS